MRLVIVTAPMDVAGELGHAVIAEKLAACVNIIPKVRSIYRWEGKIEDEPEAMMLFKTTREGQHNLTRRLKTLHPYDVPEIIAFEIKSDEGNLDYLNWIQSSVC
jgi:periplasmic divalent cation tolerance protein